MSVSELPLDERQQNGDGYDAESNDSQQGIWRTREVRVESDDERDDVIMDRNYREGVPENLRSPRR